MASGEKTNDVFTRTGMGDSPSNGIMREKIGHGQTLQSAHGMDNVHGYDTPGDFKGVHKFGGGDTYLGHSLKGSSAVQAPHVGTKDGVS